MKRLLLSFSLLLLLSTIVFPLTPIERVQADHNPAYNQCVTGVCSPEIEVRLTDPSITDANITWRRAEAITEPNLDEYFEYNSGTLLFHDVEGDPHYHTPGGILAINDGDSLSLFPCDFGTRNDIIFSINGQSNLAIINLCEENGPIIELELEAPTDTNTARCFIVGSSGQAEITCPSTGTFEAGLCYWRDTSGSGWEEFTCPDDGDVGTGPGSAEITINDLNRVLDVLQASGLSECNLVNNTTGETFNCLDLLASELLTISGTTIIFVGLPPSEYTLTVSYEEICYSLAFDCRIEDQTSFSQGVISFTIEAGMTTQATLDVAAIQEFNDEGNDGAVPPGRPESELPCDDGSLNNALEWLVCPVVSGLFWAIDTFYKTLIIPLLSTTPLQDAPDASTPEGAIFVVWNNFRVLANILFVVAFLGAILGQSMSGFQAFAAYDIRKILPRLVIGIIGIQLSWYLVAFTVDLFNILGAGVRGLVLAPVEGLSLNGDFELNSAWDELSLIIGITGVAVGLYWVGGILMGLPLILFPIILGLILAFITILARNVLIILLIVASPVAFVAWILPNTSSLFQKWWEWFWKALIVYPLIILFISAGELFAKVIWGSNTSEAGTQNNAATSIIAMIALFAPYFLIPLVFRFAGGLLAEVTNGLDRRGKSLNQRVFGVQHDEGSWRGRRKTKQEVRRSRRKTRIGNRAEQMSGSKRRLVRGAGKTMGFINARTRGGAASIEAQRMADAREWVRELTGSARDEEIYAALGDYNILDGSRISDEYRIGSEGARKDPYKVQAALDYAVSKANDENYDLDVVRNRFMNGQYGEEKKRNFSGGMNDIERKKAWSRSMDRFQDVYGDYKYRDGHTGELTKDSAQLARFAREVNSRKSGGRTLAPQRESYFNGISEMSDTARGIYERAGGKFENGKFDGSGFNARNLSNQDRELLSQMKTMREGMRETPTYGGAATANEAKSRANRSLAWLDDPRLRGL